jgi:hypothetical protein
VGVDPDQIRVPGHEDGEDQFVHPAFRPEMQVLDAPVREQAVVLTQSLRGSAQVSRQILPGHDLRDEPVRDHPVLQSARAGDELR